MFRLEKARVTTMTALSDYAKLEAEAVFFDAQSGVSTEVILSFGERSLMIVGLDDRALAHWPLASLHCPDAQVNASIKIAPDRSAEDFLRLQDQEMITAIQAVCPNLYDAPTEIPKKRIPRWLWPAMLIVFLVLGGIFSVPMVKTKIIDDITADQEVRLGRAMRSHVITVLQADRPALWECTEPEGRQALDSVVMRIGEAIPGQSFSVIDLQDIGLLTLPGGETMIFRGLLDTVETPEGLAGVLAHQMVHMKNRDALKNTVAAFRPMDLLKFWWGGEPTDEVLETSAQASLARPFTPEAEAAANAGAIVSLTEARLPTRPFAKAIESWRHRQNSSLAFITRHPGGPDRIAKINAADQIGENPFKPALDDRSWLALGNICDERQPFE